MHSICLAVSELVTIYAPAETVEATEVLTPQIG